MDKGSGIACMSLNIAKSRRFGMALAVSHGNCEHTCLTLETYHGLRAPLGAIKAHSRGHSSSRSIGPSGREARIDASTIGTESDQEGGASNGRQAG